MQTNLLPAGAILGNYEIRGPLGSGGMGVVYEAAHRSLGRRVALKVLHTRAMDSAQAELSRGRFLREGRAAAQVRHPHIVDVFDFGMEKGVAFLVMELVEGETLAQLLKRETRLTMERTVEILLPVVSAVAELHAAGIVHRDLKPANILLSRRRGRDVNPKVADFGVSRLDDGSPSITQSGVMLGTLEYMSPEQMRATKEVTEQSDQYALGVMLYECTTGRKPFSGESNYDLMHAIVTAVVPPPSEHNAVLSRAWDDVAMRAMSRYAEKRFASVDELGEALLPFATEAVAARWRSEFVPSEGKLAIRPREAPEPAFAHTPPTLAEPAARKRTALALVGGGIGVLTAGLLVAIRVMHGATPSPSVVEASAANAAPFREIDASVSSSVQGSPAGNVAPASVSSSSPSASGAAPLYTPQPPRVSPKPRATRPAPAATALTPPTSSSLPPSPPRGDHGAPVIDVP